MKSTLIKIGTVIGIIAVIVLTFSLTYNPNEPLLKALSPLMLVVCASSQIISHVFTEQSYGFSKRKIGSFSKDEIITTICDALSTFTLVLWIMTFIAVR